MALKKTKLTEISNVTGINTVGIFTAGVTQTAAGVAGTSYIKSIIMHNTGIATCSSSIYVYPNGVSSSGIAQTAYRLGRVDLPANDTYFFEFNYPLVMVNNDKLIIEVGPPDVTTGGIGIGSMVNVQIFGDTDI